MGSLQRILSWRTQLDLLLKLQSDSNRKKELVKECKLEHRSSKNGLQARASLPTATDLWQYSDRNWKDCIFVRPDDKFKLYGSFKTWPHQHMMTNNICITGPVHETLTVGHPGRNHLPQGAHSHHQESDIPTSYTPWYHASRKAQPHFWGMLVKNAQH